MEIKQKIEDLIKEHKIDSISDVTIRDNYLSISIDANQTNGKHSFLINYILKWGFKFNTLMHNETGVKLTFYDERGY